MSSQDQDNKDNQTPKPTSSSKEEGLSTGSIIGIVLASIIFVAGCVAVYYWYKSKRESAISIDKVSRSFMTPELLAYNPGIAASRSYLFRKNKLINLHI